MIKILNSVTKQDRLVTPKDFKKIVKLGLLYSFKERLEYILYEDEVVLKRTLSFLKSINKIDKEVSFNNISKQRLVKESRKHYKPIIGMYRELRKNIKDTLNLDIGLNFERELNISIDKVKKGNDNLKDIKIPKRLFVTNYPIRSIQKPIKSINECKLGMPKAIPETYVQRVFTKVHNQHRDEDVYYGKLFPLSDKNKNILIGFMNNLTKNKK